MNEKRGKAANRKQCREYGKASQRCRVLFIRHILNGAAKSAIIRAVPGTCPPTNRIAKSAMQTAFHDKANRLFSTITNDPRWDINDELLFQVAGFTFYGYCFGFGRLVCLMDADDIDAYAAGKLTGLGAGAKYVQGMIARARQDFVTDEDAEPANTDDPLSRLIGIGHAHFPADDFSPLVESVYENYSLLSGE